MSTMTRSRRTKHDNATDKENTTVNGNEPDTKPTRVRSKRKVYCTCKQSDDGSPMILCSDCKEWYHFHCVALSEEDAEDIRLYICPSCHAKTGLHTVMNWEGPEAVEECPTKLNSSTASTSQLKSTKTRPKSKPAEPEEEEESSSNDESEDEYVADDSKSQPKRRTRKLSLSDDLTSSDDDEPGSQKALKRLRRPAATPKDVSSKKESASPGPSNARKRRPSTVTHAAPQAKRRKSESTPGEDATRKYCATKLEELFAQIFLRYPILPQDETEDGDDIKPSKKTEELTPEEKELVEGKAKVFVGDLEQCLFDLYSEPDKAGKPHAGAKYKERFRMLTFNLSKTDRVVLHMRIASSHISAEELSTMSSTDLANEEQKQSIKLAEKEALAQTILKKTVLPRAKMTHKGMQDIEDINGTAARERQTEAEEEDRIERERQARLRLQAERAQAQSAKQGSAPPESPITPTWGGPPPVPGPGGPNRPLFVSTGSDMISASEGELNLADLINIDDEPSNDDLSISLTIPPPPIASTVPASPSTETPTTALSQNPAQSPASHATGISPFAAKPESGHRSSFDLSSLWSPAKDDGDAKAEQDAMLVEEPDQMEDDSKSPQQTSMEVDVLSNGGGAGDQDFDMFLQQDEDKEGTAQSGVPETKPPTFDELPHVWSGKISMPLDSTVPQEVTLFARQVGGRSLGGDSPLWKTLFPVDHLRIDGRVPIDKSAEYLTQTRLNATKELIAAAFSPGSEGSNSPFDALIRYLLGKGRHGLVFPWGPRPKDNHPGRELYIIPLLSSEVIPEYMELLDDLQLPKTRSSDLLIGIWVLNKGKLVAPPSTPPIHSLSPTSIPLPPVPIPPPQAQPQLAQNATIPPYSLPITDIMSADVTAQIASLTPEQIQLMLRTLQASTTPQSVQAPPPIGIPQASLQQWTNPAPAAPYPPYAPVPGPSPPPSAVPYVPPPGPSGPSGPGSYPPSYDYDRYSEYPDYPRDQYESHGGRRGGPRGGGNADRGPRHRGRGRNVSRGGSGYGGSRDGGWKNRGRGRDRGGPASPPRDGGRWGGGPPPYNNQWNPS